MTASVPAEALTWLVGARLQRIDSPRPDLFALTFFAAGLRQTLLISLAHPVGAGLTRERPRGEAATPFVTKLRNKLENARLLRSDAFRPSGQPHRALALELTLARGNEQHRLLADFHPQHPNLVLLAEERTTVFSLHEKALKAREIDRRSPYVVGELGRGATFPDEMIELERIGKSLGSQAVEGAREALRKAMLTTLRARKKRIERRVQAIREDLVRAETAPQLRQQAEILLCNLDAIPRGSSSVELGDLATGEPVVIALDPSMSAVDNANRRFERARKFERGLRIARQRLEETERERDLLVQELARVETLSAQELSEGPNQDGDTSVHRLTSSRSKGQQQHKPHRTFDLPSGRVLVGKGAIDNDTLTLTIARPHDHWLHARGVHGAHVIVQRERGKTLSAELLLDAAHLAAHFSDARGEAQVEVQHTERRYVRKGKKSAPGAVQLDREKVMLLRIEPERLARLLKTELSD